MWSSALFIGLQLVRDQLMRAEATWLEAGDGDFSGVMIYDSAFTEDATGALVTSKEAYNRFPEVFRMEGSGIPPGRPRSISRRRLSCIRSSSRGRSARLRSSASWWADWRSGSSRGGVRTSDELQN